MKTELSDTSLKTIVLQCGAGSHLSQCGYEALQVSLEFRCDVEYIHNGKLFRVEFMELLYQATQEKAPE
jgi:hypothetical protein